MINVRRIVRVLAIVCLLFVFMPTFLVSCSGQNIEISASKVATGISVYGEQVSEPQPVILIVLVIPIAIFAVTFLKQLVDKNKGLAIASLSVADIVIWFIFQNAVKSAASEKFCEFSSTGWFWCNLIALILMAASSALVVLEKATMDSDLKELIEKKQTNNKESN